MNKYDLFDKIKFCIFGKILLYMVGNNNFKKIPAVDKLLNNSFIVDLIARTNSDLVKFVIRKVIDSMRESMKNGGDDISLDDMFLKIERLVLDIHSPSLRAVVNGSGIILHTNLGRAPLGVELLSDVSSLLSGYSNLEFNLSKGSRGERNSHPASILRYLTGAEDVIVVNNNAAAVMFLLAAFGKRKESIVSRGELIEIGGSFRIPDIMKASGSKMVEVGSTNKTKVSDYQDAITDKTAVLFKAHRSNYVIKGFSEEVSIKELAEIGRRNNLISIYDIGSGLLRKVDSHALRDEPDVKEAVSAGVDLVCFSGDKLLGAGQAGIIVGKKKYIDILKKHPMLRALRVCKTTLAILERACSYYLDDKKLFKNNILFATLNKKECDIELSANMLKDELFKLGIVSEVSKSEGQYGGGTLPDLKISSFQVKINIPNLSPKSKKMGKVLFNNLLLIDMPILTNLKSGDVYVDMLSINNCDIPMIAQSINKTINNL